MASRPRRVPADQSFITQTIDVAIEPRLSFEVGRKKYSNGIQTEPATSETRQTGKFNICVPGKESKKHWLIGLPVLSFAVCLHNLSLFGVDVDNVGHRICDAPNILSQAVDVDIDPKLRRLQFLFGTLSTGPQLAHEDRCDRRSLLFPTSS